MAKYTKNAIIQTFEEMLSEMPFDKITVTALTERSNISFNTFYYHYQDIYDLLDTWLDMKTLTYLGDIGVEEDWRDIFKRLLYAIKKNPLPVYHIADSISRERLERFIFKQGEEHGFAKP